MDHFCELGVNESQESNILNIQIVTASPFASRPKAFMLPLFPNTDFYEHYIMSANHDLFLRLSRSAFRQRFHLGPKERDYCYSKGKSVVASHAADFIAQRLAPAQPKNDGTQTPMRGHPVFIAQHATATCCRGCLSKWHGIAKQRPLTAEEQHYIVGVILQWIEQDLATAS